MGRKNVTCTFCDNLCSLAANTRDDCVSLRPANPEILQICPKAHMWEEYQQHELRITKPLKNVGKRGEGIWEEVSWNTVLDEIAEKLQGVIAKWGAEAIGISECAINHGFGGITRRFMNCIGTPNYIAPQHLCMGNTAQVHRATYGWYTTANWDKADVIVYFGQNRGSELWPGEYFKLKSALKRGAALIEIDPKTTETASLADHHLRIRYGTDTALLLSWINVVINENLYDEKFVAENTYGFDDLKKRVQIYTPQWAEKACGINAETIRLTARIYAGAKAAIIPWGVVGDMQKNSTSMLRCQCILRAICGYINVSELVFGPATGFITNSELAGFDLLSNEQKAKQLGTENYPLFTFKGGSHYEAALHEVGIDHYPDILGCSCMAHPPTLFAAMREEEPYAVKAFFAVANNTIMSYANQQGIVDAFMNQELVVAFENVMSPTAQLADYVLPGDMWAERDVLGPQLDVAPVVTFSEHIACPVEECKDWYYVVKGLADRLGLSEQFPWQDSHALHDYRLGKLDETWNESPGTVIPLTPAAFGKFLTPTGKVELRSTVLESLGYDPLPYYLEHGEEGVDESEYPFVIFAGYRERPNYNTCLRHIKALRQRQSEPLLFINPSHKDEYDLEEESWVKVSTTLGSIELMAHLDDTQPPGTLRIPHGWWKPEQPQGLSADLSKATQHNDGVLFSDADWNLDKEQGVVNLRGGVRAKIEVLKTQRT